MSERAAPARRRVVVIGGANTDVTGRSHASLRPRDSNPGSAHVSAGGVARNIAENLALLGVDVALVTAFGGDHNARELQRGCEAAGIDTTASLVCEDLPGSVYLAILDEDGDMALALSDMRALERLDAEALQRLARDRVAAAEAVVCDANLSAEALEWVAATARGPVVLDAVSTTKAQRARGVLSRLAAVKCNAEEAAAILGECARCAPEAVGALAAALVERGAGVAVVTDGARGVHVATRSGRSWLPAPAAEVVNATGAGDAFTAGFAAGLLGDEEPARAARFGSAMAALTLASEDTVSPAVSHAKVTAMVEGMG